MFPSKSFVVVICLFLLNALGSDSFIIFKLCILYWSVADELEKEIATHSSSPMDRGGWGSYSPWGCKELDTTEHMQACIAHQQCCNIFRCSAE